MDTGQVAFTLLILPLFIAMLSLMPLCRIGYEIKRLVSRRSDNI
jgi:hypothetical protein